jgi:hypothetical protein
MSGYGYYDEEEGEGLLTGAGARAKKRFVATRAISEITGRVYPKRVGYTLEYASKILYNSDLAKKNKWLQFANNDPGVKAARNQMKAAMRNAAKAWRARIEKEHADGKISDAEFQKYQARWARAKKTGKKYRLHVAQSRIKNFKDKFPTAADAVNFFNNPINRKIAPIGRSAKIIFLRAVYGLSKEDAEKFYPKHMKTPKSVKFVYPIEEASIFNIPEYNPPEEGEEKPAQQQTTTTETQTLKKKKQRKQKNKIILDKDIGFIIKTYILQMFDPTWPRFPIKRMKYKDFKHIVAFKPNGCIQIDMFSLGDKAVNYRLATWYTIGVDVFLDIRVYVSIQMIKIM